MIDIVFLIGAIALLIVLQMYRSVLAFVFPTARSRRVDLAKAPDGAADLYAQAHADLVTLGFSGPQWHLLRLGDTADDAAHFYATYTHERGDVCRLYPLIGLDKPNRLNVVFATRLVDGRTAIGQAFDPFFEIIASDRFPARTIGGATLAGQWRAHGEFVASLGAAPDPAGATADAGAFDVEMHDGARTRLLAERKAWLDSRGWARPTLAFACRMLRAVVRRPKAPPNTEPMPPARLAALALMQQRLVERPAPRRMQALLFAISVALFLALGAAFWSPGFALVLFVVIAIHELGHYLAMRAFGYRNVQMLALPLVGGVTIGHEAKPDAARRAWMSLMGPLPGVVIGWAMLLAMPHLGAGVPSWWMTAAWVFLAVNYLNVLPVPPLDGGHVVQALLPVRAARLQAVFIVIACVIGALIAYRFGFMLLVVLALMQLTLASTHWQLARVIDVARGDAALDPQRPRALRLRRLFEIADDVVGPTPRAAPRIAQATQALQSLDVRPMGWLQRGVIGTVYAALLAGPVVAAVAMWGFASRMPTEAEMAASADRAERQRADMERKRVALAARAAALDVGTLLRARADEASWPPPASDEAIAATQVRLGITLPDDLVALYRAHDGLPELGFAPLASMARWRDAPAPALDAAAPDGTVEVNLRGGDDSPSKVHSVPRARAAEWLMVMPAEDGSFFAYDVGDTPAVPGHRVFEGLDGYVVGHPSLRAWLEEQWISAEHSRDMARQARAAGDAAERELAGLPVLALIDRLPKPGFLERMSGADVSLPPPAGDAAIASVQERLGIALDDDLRDLLLRHDGLPALLLLPVADYRRLDLADADHRQDLERQLGSRHRAFEPPHDWPKSADELEACIAIGGGPAPRSFVSVLWCPTHEAPRRYVDLFDRRFHATLTGYLRARVASMKSPGS